MSFCMVTLITLDQRLIIPSWPSSSLPLNQENSVSFLSCSLCLFQLQISGMLKYENKTFKRSFIFICALYGFVTLSDVVVYCAVHCDLQGKNGQYCYRLDV